MCSLVSDTIMTITRCLDLIMEISRSKCGQKTYECSENGLKRSTPTYVNLPSVSL